MPDMTDAAGDSAERENRIRISMSDGDRQWLAAAMQDAALAIEYIGKNGLSRDFAEYCRSGRKGRRPA